MSFNAYKIIGIPDREEPINDVSVSHNSISDTYCIRIGKQEVWFTGDELERLAVLLNYDGWFAERIEKMRIMMAMDESPYEILVAHDISNEQWGSAFE